jgi:tetraacyldisaccharide 4'-kinase
MKAPSFWWKLSPTIFAYLLKPLGWIYSTITVRRMHQQGVRVDALIVCVGNFTVGGSGKTPVVQEVARLLHNKNSPVFILARGYGGTCVEPTRVDKHKHTAQDVGDEPLLHALTFPVIVSADRVKGAHLAITQGAKIIVMDDGLQNPSLHKNVRLSVVDGEVGWGNALCLPAGPLRAPLNAQWPHTDALIVVGKGIGGTKASEQAIAKGVRVFQASLTPDPDVITALSGKNVIAFAGIGRPEKFFQTLSDCGANVLSRYAFADHRPYHDDEIKALREQAVMKNAHLVTTTKDAARLTSTQREMLGDMLHVLPVKLTFHDEKAFMKWLTQLSGNKKRLT